MKILSISDLHAQLPDTSQWPEADIFIIAGDSLPDFRTEMEVVLRKQREFCTEKFNPWLNGIQAKYKIITGANHDHLFDVDPEWSKANIEASIECGSKIIEGIPFYFSPYSYSPPTYPATWSFGQTEDGLAQIYDQIPEDTHVIVSHTAPFGILDAGFNGQSEMKNFGSISLQRYLKNSCPYNLKLFIAGHIHEWGGQQIKYHRQRNDSFIMANVSADPYFRVDGKQTPMLFEI